MIVHKKKYFTPPVFLNAERPEWGQQWGHKCGLAAQEMGTDNDSEVTCPNCLRMMQS